MSTVLMDPNRMLETSRMLEAVVRSQLEDAAVRLTEGAPWNLRPDLRAQAMQIRLEAELEARWKIKSLANSIGDAAELMLDADAAAMGAGGGVVGFLAKSYSQFQSYGKAMSSAANSKWWKGAVKNASAVGGWVDGGAKQAGKWFKNLNETRLVKRLNPVMTVQSYLTAWGESKETNPLTRLVDTVGSANGVGLPMEMLVGGAATSLVLLGKAGGGVLAGDMSEAEDYVDRLARGEHDVIQQGVALGLKHGGAVIEDGVWSAYAGIGHALNPGSDYWQNAVTGEPSTLRLHREMQAGEYGIMGKIFSFTAN